MASVVLNNPPSDGITAISFGIDTRLLFVSSWDSWLRVYDIDANVVPLKMLQPCPLLDCACLTDAVHAVSAGLDGAVRLYGIHVGGESILGRHEGAVRCVRACAALGTVVSGSWDHTIKVWDIRCADACIGTYRQPDKVLAISTGASVASSAESKPWLVVATGGRHVLLLDLRKPSEPVQQRESSLKGQTRCVSQMPSGSGYVQGSVEGRVSVEYYNAAAEYQKRKYAFKCHHSVANGIERSCPVNAITFHPRFGTFATGGGDGQVCIWDGDNKKRICQFERFSSSVAALSFSPDGHCLAIAASYTWENGERAHAPDAIHVKKVMDVDVMPRLQHVMM